MIRRPRQKRAPATSNRRSLIESKLIGAHANNGKPQGQAQKWEPAVLAFVVDCLAYRYQPHKVWTKLKESFGLELTEKKLDAIINTARGVMVMNAKKSKEIALGESVGFYESVISNDEVECKNKISAQTRLDDLYGLGNTKKDVANPEDVAEYMRKVAKAMREATACTDPDEVGE